MTKHTFRRFSKSLCTTVVLVITLSRCFLYPKEEKILAPPLVQAVEVSYDLITVNKATIEKRVTGIGFFVSENQVDHFFKYQNGRIKAIHASIGQTVRQGQLLAELETENLMYEIEQQKLNVEMAQTRYEILVNSDDDTSAVDLASLDVDLAQLNLGNLRRELQEAKHLSSVEGLTSATRSKINGLEEGIKSCELDLQKARIRYKKTNSDLIRARDHKEKESHLAYLDLEMQKLKVKALERQLDQSRLVASTSGAVVFLDPEMREGDNVTAYQTFLTVADPTKLQLEYSGQRIAEFRLGMDVAVTIDDEEFEAEVVMTPLELPQIADERLLGKVRIKVENIPEKTSIGDTAGVRLVLEKKDDVIIVPRRAVRLYMGRNYVHVLEDGIKRERDVKVGIETATEVEIEMGLETGDQVLVR